MIGRRVTKGASFTAAILVGIFGLVVVLDRLFPPPIDRGRIVSFVANDRRGAPMRAFPVEDGRWRLAASLGQIDADFVEALITIEDKRFYDHPGVDGLAVMRASRDIVTTGKIRSGASTITMQTARLLEPRPRNVGSKFAEMLRALQIEARLTKTEILELYLTLTPYGGNLEGVRAASWAWFGREPDELTPDQIALLIALPQAPETRRPDRKPHNAKLARKSILDRMAHAGLIDKARAADAADEGLPDGRNAFPADAWHASEAIRGQSNTSSVTSTLDLSLQREAEQIIAALANSAGDGVQAAAIIVSTEDRAVRAAIGSGGRDRAGGWMDLTTRRRSPGSTLKPLIYAMAFDDGLATGTTRIADLPARFQTYRPENFDRTFRGEVTVAQALQHSLNVPAVQLLDAVGANRFVSAVRYSGSDAVLPTRTETEAGLAVALGGLGMTVQDIAVLYAALAERGVAKPLVWEEHPDTNTEDQSGFSLVSAESAEEVLSILASAPPPPGRMPAALSASAPQIAFKTGTSYGFRDAWAAGVGGGYAIVVWTGRPDGAPRPGVTGRQGALPTLFNLFDAAERSGVSGDKRLPLAAPQPLAQQSAMGQFAKADLPPMILFPPENAEIWSDKPGRSFVLSASGQKPLQWYADGEIVPKDAGGAPIWTPQEAGFYRLVVVDGAGRSQSSKVRVRVE